MPLKQRPPSMRDQLSLRGEVSFFTFPKNDPENLTPLRQKSNQTQWKGARHLAQMLSQGWSHNQYCSFISIKASTMLNTVGEDNNVAIPKGPFPIFTGTTSPEVEPIPYTDFDALGENSGLLIPGEQTYPELVSHNDSFYTRYPSKTQSRQYVEGVGTFMSPPPSPVAGVPGIFYHFGLYMSSLRDAEEILFAYHFAFGGISYDSEAGLKVIWRIWLGPEEDNT